MKRRLAWCSGPRRPRSRSQRPAPAERSVATKQVLKGPKRLARSEQGVVRPHDPAVAPAFAARAADADRECRTRCAHSPGVEMVVQLYDYILRSAPLVASLPAISLQLSAFSRRRPADSRLCLSAAC